MWLFGSKANPTEVDWLASNMEIAAQMFESKDSFEMLKADLGEEAEIKKTSNGTTIRIRRSLNGNCGIEFSIENELDWEGKEKDPHLWGSFLGEYYGVFFNYNEPNGFSLSFYDKKVHGRGRNAQAAFSELIRRPGFYDSSELGERLRRQF
jgi:hypothetical protein